MTYQLNYGFLKAFIDYQNKNGGIRKSLRE